MVKLAIILSIFCTGLILCGIVAMVLGSILYLNREDKTEENKEES